MNNLPLSHTIASDNGRALAAVGALEPHTRWLRTVARVRLGDEHAVDEVLQEASLVILRRGSAPVDPARMAPWLYRIVVRETVNYRRRCGRQRRLVQSWGERQGVSRPEPPNPRDWVMAAETRHLVSQALGDLPRQAQEILLLKYTQGWTCRQLAEHLGVKEKTVEYRLLKARQALRASLCRRGIGESVDE